MHLRVLRIVANFHYSERIYIKVKRAFPESITVTLKLQGEDCDDELFTNSKYITFKSGILAP